MNSNAIEAIFRRSYGKLLASLLAKSFELHVAEDALSFALLQAVTRWQGQLPENPEAWLHTVAIRRAIDERRKIARTTAIDAVAEPITEMNEPTDDMISDERLRLFFLCTHPAIHPDAQTPLMLQLLCGMTAEEIAKLYLVSPAQVSQLLVRAKRKIRDANIVPILPREDQLDERSQSVREAIYGLYAKAWEDTGESVAAKEALDLSEVLTMLMADSPETLGLRALILYCEARRPARLSADGSLIPLDAQDARLWHEPFIAEAESLLRRAGRSKSLGRFQLESAIQSCHIGRITQDGPPWSTILALYDRLLEFAPTVGNQLGRLAVMAKAISPTVALDQLLELDLPETYQPRAALLSHLYQEINNHALAFFWARVARDLSSSPSAKRHFDRILISLQIHEESPAS